MLLGMSEHVVYDYPLRFNPPWKELSDRLSAVEVNRIDAVFAPVVSAASKAVAAPGPRRRPRAPERRLTSTMRRSVTASCGHQVPAFSPLIAEKLTTPGWTLVCLDCGKARAVDYARACNDWDESRRAARGAA